MRHHPSTVAAGRAAMALVMLCAAAVGCSSSGGAGSQAAGSASTTSAGQGSSTTAGASTTVTAVTGGAGRGFPDAGPWVSYLGDAGSADLHRIASTFRVINIDADPGQDNFSPTDIAELKAGGRNRVLTYFDIGSAEHSRDYWTHVPPGFVSADANKAAQLGPYQGVPDEVWMDPSNAEWRRLLVDYVAPRLVAQGVDGFYLDNLEVVEHDEASGQPVCSAKCSQGGLDLVGALRAKYPNLLFVMQNATGDVTRNGRVGGALFGDLLDGIAHEEVFTGADPGPNETQSTYRVQTDDEVVGQLHAWQAMNLRPGGHPLWIGTEDYVNTCSNGADAAVVQRAAAAENFSTYVSDKSSQQGTVCFW